MPLALPSSEGQSRSGPSQGTGIVLGRYAPGAPSSQLPLIESPRPQAGFPSPAADYVENTLDLMTLMVTNPPATFYVRCAGDSMADAGILDGDILVVDRSLTPRSRQIVVAVYDGEIYVKRLFRGRDRGELRSENAAKASKYPPMEISEDHSCEIWGVVTGAVRKF